MVDLILGLKVIFLNNIPCLDLAIVFVSSIVENE